MIAHTYPADKNALEAQQEQLRKIQRITFLVVGALMTLPVLFLPISALIKLGGSVIIITSLALTARFMPVPNSYDLSENHIVTLTDDRLESFDGKIGDIILYSAISRVAVLLTRTSQVKFLRIFAKGRRLPLNLSNLQNMNELYAVLKGNLNASVKVVEETENSPAFIAKGVLFFAILLGIIAGAFLLVSASL